MTRSRHARPALLVVASASALAVACGAVYFFPPGIRAPAAVPILSSPAAPTPAASAPGPASPAAPAPAASAPGPASPSASSAAGRVIASAPPPAQTPQGLGLVALRPVAIAGGLSLALPKAWKARVSEDGTVRATIAPTAGPAHALVVTPLDPALGSRVDEALLASVVGTLEAAGAAVPSAVVYTTAWGRLDVRARGGSPVSGWVVALGGRPYLVTVTPLPAGSPQSRLTPGRGTAMQQVEAVLSSAL